MVITEVDSIGPSPGIRLELFPDAVTASLEVRNDPGVPPLRLSRDTPIADGRNSQPLSIIQYPPGKPKILSFHKSLVTIVTEPPGGLGYFTDTSNAVARRRELGQRFVPRRN
jgi:hypothetical protein